MNCLIASVGYYSKLLKNYSPLFFLKFSLISITIIITCLAAPPSLAAATTIADLESNLKQQQITSDRIFILFATALVFIMQAGFLCLEVGLVQKKNGPAIAVKNLIDWVVLSIAFFVIGFGFMFGNSFSGWIGTDFFLLNNISSNPNHLQGLFFLFHLAFAGTALTIISGAMSERTAFIPYIVGSIMIGAVIYPIFGHWAWSDLFVANNPGWLHQLGFMDYAGATVVHTLGAWAALVGCIMVGPRIGRYDAEGNIIQIKSSNIAFSGLGVLILWFGWWGFNSGNSMRMSDTVSLVILNTNLAAATAGIAAFFHCFHLQQRNFLYEKLIGGTIGGLVAITACCNVVTPLGAIFVGLSTGIIHNYAFNLLAIRLRIDDPVGAIPIHGACGIWGTLCVALVGQQELLALPRMEQLGVQIIGILICMAWTVSTAFLMFKLLKITVGLRVSPDIEQQGIDIANEFAHESELLDEELITLLQEKLAKEESTSIPQVKFKK